MFTIGFEFHLPTNAAITYTVTGVDKAKQVLSLAYVADGENRTSEYYLPMAEKFLKDGTWLEGKGCDVMMIKLKTGYMFASGNNTQAWEYQKRLEAVSGQWLEVDTKHLHKDQYSTVCGLHIMDKIVTEVKNDKRIGEEWQGKNKPQFIRWEGVRPSSHCFWSEFLPADQNPTSETLWDNDNKFFPDNFTLSTFMGAAYVYSNNRRTNVRFLYRDGTFYDLDGGLLKGVSEKPMKALRKFFESYYK